MISLPHLEPIGALAIVFLTIAVAGVISKSIRMTPILLEISMGIILGASVLNVLELTPELTFLSDMGFIMLMFLAGLEFTFHDLGEKLNKATLIALPSMVVAIVFVVLIYPFGWFGVVELLLIGTIFSATSIGVTLPVLKNYISPDSKLYNTVLLAAMIIDVGTITLAGLIIGFVSQPDASIILLLEELIIVAGFILLAFFAASKFNLYYFSKVDEDNENNWNIKFAFAVLGGVLLFGELLGVETPVAAFFAGMFVSQATHLGKEDEAKLDTIGYGFLIPVFFFVVGMQFDLSVLMDPLVILQVTVIFLVGVGGKIVGTVLGGKLAGVDTKKSLLIGTSFSASLSVGFAVLTLGTQANILSTTTFTIIATYILLTTFFVPVTSKFIASIYDIRRPPRPSPLTGGLEDIADYSVMETA